MSAIQIRPYEDRDVAQMTAIWNEVVEAGRAFPQVDPLDETTAPIFFAEQDRCGVATDGSAVQGLYILHPNNVGRCGHTANASYAVSSQLRGQGIGRLLVSDSLAAAGELGYRGLQFNAVVASNAYAMHLYEDLGFRRVGMIPGGFLNKAGSYEDMFIYFHACNAPRDGQMLDVPQVVALEQKIASEGTSLAELMDHAGAALAQGVMKAKERQERLNASRYEEDEPCRVAVLCGKGNNGGDGWVAARLLADAGFFVTLITPCPAAELTAEPAHSAALRLPHTVEVLVDPSPQVVQVVLASSDIALDALLGTGFSHESVREPLASWIYALNDQHARRLTGLRPLTVISADVASGLSAQTGIPAATCVRADETVTMLAYKPGLFARQAVPYSGRITLAPLI